ncbi:hypothetical protein [Bradyrhizobium sp. URHD0069]|uniref:hypothetical protein n=1 Tax=Bradyrhizobium sp. URHD0069 TaxID=1380355 RepID=UPI000497E342|nr:hypothetical protein [Bradyrhizobium sp. URHD0069]
MANRKTTPINHTRPADGKHRLADLATLLGLSRWGKAVRQFVLPSRARKTPMQRLSELHRQV